MSQPDRQPDSPEPEPELWHRQLRRRTENHEEAADGPWLRRAIDSSGNTWLLRRRSASSAGDGAEWWRSVDHEWALTVRTPDEHSDVVEAEETMTEDATGNVVEAEAFVEAAARPTRATSSSEAHTGNVPARNVPALTNLPKTPCKPPQGGPAGTPAAPYQAEAEARPTRATSSSTAHTGNVVEAEGEPT